MQHSTIATAMWVTMATLAACADDKTASTSADIIGDSCAIHADQASCTSEAE